MPESRRRSPLPPLRHERLYESLATHISDFIEAQGLSGGDRLPSERQFAADLGVSRATLARALASLETQGRIEVRHGVGALVRDPGDTATPTGGSEAAAGTDWSATVAAHPRAEVSTAREAVLAGIARAAAANPQTALRLAMLADDGRPRSFEHSWRCIRRLADSPLLADLDDLLAAHAPDPDDGPRLQASLGALSEAIIQGDASAAATGCIGMLAD